MGCSCGGVWNPDTGQCSLCSKVGPYKSISYADLLSENAMLRKIIEDLCECDDHGDEIRKQAREYLKLT